MLAEHAVYHEADDKAQQQTNYCEHQIVFVHDWWGSLLSRLQQPANLFAQLWVVCVAVAGDSVIYGGLEHFFFRTLEAQRATAFAGMVAAINGFSLWV